jgi:hypothetical protein
VVIFIATFDVEINSGYLKKTDNFLSQNANLMVSTELTNVPIQN